MIDLLSNTQIPVTCPSCNNIFSKRFRELETKDPAAYIRESIERPSAYIVPGPMYSAAGTSFMPPTYAKDLGPERIDQLVAYLATLK